MKTRSGRLGWVLVSGLVIARSSGSAEPASTPADPTTRERRVDALVEPYLERGLFSGVVLLAEGDRVLVERAYGLANSEFEVPNRVDTRFPIASLTKRFTQLVVQRLVDEAKLSPGDPLARWEPAFPSADKITIQHLLSHRSGLRDPEVLRQKIRTNWTTAGVVELLAKQPLGSVPGETYFYTTANYALLAYVVEQVTGKSFAEVVARYVYEPAEMRDSGELVTTAVVLRLASGYMPDPFGRGLAVCGPEDTSWKAGGGSSYSTAADLHRFLRALYGGRLSSVPATTLFPSGSLLGRAAFRSMGSFPGANASLIYFPAEQVSVVVLSNNYAPMPGPIAEAVAKLHFGEPVAPPKAPATMAPGPIDPRLPGRYRLEGFPDPFTIELRFGTPLLSWNAVRQSAFERVEERTWFSPFDWSTVTFDADYRRATWTAPWSEKPLTVTREGP